MTAPGVRVAPPEPVRALVGVRRDVAAFVGVAPRGPVRVPVDPLEPDTDVAGWLTGPTARSVAVPVTSWDEYRLRFGGFDGPGRLPYAVSAFFAQGGERAWVVRIVHDHGDPATDAAGRAGGRLGELAIVGGAPLVLHARDEGTWGNSVRAELGLAARPLPVLPDPGAGELRVAEREWVPAGSLLRLRLPGDRLQLRYVERSEVRPDPAGGGRHRLLTLDAAASDRPGAVEVVTGTLTVTDPDPGVPRFETHPQLGLRADHPRWLARVLAAESALLAPDPGWANGDVDRTLLDPRLEPVRLCSPDGARPHLTGGADRWQHIVPEDFWDAGWLPGDETPGAGVHCLAENDEVGLLVVPDLYEPAPLPPIDEVTEPGPAAGPEFAPCVPFGARPGPTERPPGLDGLALDPRDRDDLERIVYNQLAMVGFAEQRRDLTVLLDVPPELPPPRVLRWRDAFDSPFAAAYHPWLDVATPDDARDALIRVNPSAFAAGIIADRERRLGVQHGPANQVAVGAVRAVPAVTGPQHDELHPAGINVYRAERAGIRLTGARTLSRDPRLRQLSVARLLTVLRLTLERELDWAVFEPNGEQLWDELRQQVQQLLTRLFEAGAFAGATAAEAFFVRCDRSTMSQNDLDSGRFIALVGVAPVEPVEFLVLQLARDRDTSVQVEVVGGG